MHNEINSKKTSDENSGLDSEENPKELEAKAEFSIEIQNFLESEFIFVLSTYDMESSVYATPLFYVYSDESVFFMSEESTRHIHGLQEEHRVAGAIYRNIRNVAEIQGLQFTGKVNVCEESKYRDIYEKVFPESKKLKGILYRIELEFAKLTDNTKGFGFKKVWRKG